MKQRKDWLLHILVAVIFVIGIIARFWELGGKSLWVDEVYSLIFSSQKNWFESLVFMLADLSPPLFYLILYPTIKIFGNSEFVMRFPSFLAGSATLFIIYFGAKKVFNKFAALCALILMTFSSTLVYYSQESRSYAFFVMFSTVLILIWAEIIKKIDTNELENKLLASYSIFAFLTFLTHYWSGVLIFFQMVYMLAFAITKKFENFKRIFISCAKLSLYLCVFFFFQYSLLNKINMVFDKSLFAAVTETTPFIEGLGSLNPFFQAFNQVFYSLFYFSSINWSLLFFLVILLIIFLPPKKTFATVKEEFFKNKMASQVVFLPVIIVFPFFIYLLMTVLCSFAYPRYLLFTLPAVYLLIGYLICPTGQILSGVKLKIILLFLLCSSFFAVKVFIPEKIGNREFTFYTKPKQEWKEATQYVIWNYDNDSLIIVDRVEDFYCYYFKKFGQNIKNYNIIVDKGLFFGDRLKKQILENKGKYKKIYIFSTSMLGMEHIKQKADSVASLCGSFIKKDFANINFYECDMNAR